VNLALQWWFFHVGQGVFSLAWASLAGLFTISILTAFWCRWLDLLPPPGAWGRISKERFREIFGYGKDLFLVAVGTQLIMASQTLIITRVLGLQEAARWAVGTKMFNLISQVVWRLVDVASPAFSEMIVRGEHAVLANRFKTVTVLTASITGLCAVLYATCNADFVTVWTKGVISWPTLNDVLLGTWLIVLSVMRCYNTFAALTKVVGFMCYVYFIEGLVFVGAALLTARNGGLPAVIACSIVCTSLFSYAYGIRRITRYFQLPSGEVAWRWLAPMGRLLLIIVPVGLGVRWGLAAVPQPLTRLVLQALLCGPVSLFCFLRWGLSVSLQRELLGRVPTRARPLLGWAFQVGHRAG
jgi:O-antigen/teichoic acid export membrane protein